MISSESTFLLRTEFYGAEIKASSWNEAMEKAAKYVDESNHIYEGQQISYTVYLLPKGVYVDPEDDEHLEILEDCESQDATYLEEGGI